MSLWRLRAQNWAAMSPRTEFCAKFCPKNKSQRDLLSPRNTRQWIPKCQIPTFTMDLLKISFCLADKTKAKTKVFRPKRRFPGLVYSTRIFLILIPLYSPRQSYAFQPCARRFGPARLIPGSAQEMTMTFEFWSHESKIGPKIGPHYCGVAIRYEFPCQQAHSLFLLIRRDLVSCVFCAKI